jgi:hypothetical protein
MSRAADQGHGAGHAQFAMRPRRWYANEVAPPGRPNLKLTALLWRYRSLARHKKYDTASYYGVVLVRLRKKKSMRRR